ncbi:MAG: bifunctional nuclease family protein [Halobacteriaceae archaeon]
MDAAIEAVRVAGTPDGMMPVVLLRDADEDPAVRDGTEGGVGGEVLPIFIGFDEAVSIARGMDAIDIGRPLTHDLLLDVMEELGGRIELVAVTAVEEGTYIADLHVETPRGGVVVDARPSDSLALAARTNAPLEVAAEVFEEGRRPREEFVDLDDIREVAEL